jgi:GNAT superfamily N-acetyltransferase
MGDIDIVDIGPYNIQDYGVCFINNPKHSGYLAKVKWLKKRFEEGLKIKQLVLTETNKVEGYIEYVPGELAWRAVDAKGYMFIHCIFVTHKQFRSKGYATALLNECLKDAKLAKMNGVAVITSEGSWMAGKALFLKNGFQELEHAPPRFDLLVKKFKKSAPNPKFPIDWDKRLGKFKDLTIAYTNQCPWAAKGLKDIRVAAKELGIQVNFIEFERAKDVQDRAPSPYGIFQVVKDGRIYADNCISGTRFKNIVQKEMK